MDYVLINISGTDYKLKKSFRGLMLFEELTGKPITQMEENTGTMLKMFYCLIKGSNFNTFTFSFDEFLDLLDNNEAAVQEFSDYMTSLAQPVQKKIPNRKRG